MTDSQIQGSDTITIQRYRDPRHGVEQWIVSDEGGEFARTTTITEALRYASDLMHGPDTGPRGTVWNLMRAMEQTGYRPTGEVRMSIDEVTDDG